MAVTQVRRIRGDEATKDANGKRITERYLVYCEAGDGPLIAFDAVDPVTSLTVPDVGDAHDDDETMKVTSLHPSRWQEANNFCFLMEVQYDNGSAASQTEKKPEGEANVKWNKNVTSRGVELTENVNKNVSNLPIKNSFGDIYAATVPRVRYDAEITVSFSTDDPSQFQYLEDYRGRMNNAPVTLTITRFGVTYNRTFPAYTLKLGNATWGIDVDPEGEGMFNVQIPLLYRSQSHTDGDGTVTEIGWKTQIPDQGYNYYKADGTTKVQSETLVDLDGTGKKAAPGSEQYMNVEQLEDAVDFMLFLSGI